MSAISTTKPTPTFDPQPIFTANHFSSPALAEVSAQADGAGHPLMPSPPRGGGADEVGGGGSSPSPRPPAGRGSDKVGSEGAPLPSPSSPSGQSLVASPLFEDLLDPNLTPLRICQLHAITPAQLRRITESQEYKQALEDIAAINKNRREAINDQLRTEALASAAELIKDATKLAEDNRTNIANPRQSGIHINPTTQRQALAAATRQHAANARLLETRRKAINTILRECKPQHPGATACPRSGKPCPPHNPGSPNLTTGITPDAMQVTKSPACASTYDPVPRPDPQGPSRPSRNREQPETAPE